MEAETLARRRRENGGSKRATIASFSESESGNSASDHADTGFSLEEK